MTDTTTIKVSKSLREAVMQAARAEGLTAAEFLARVTEEHAGSRRFAAVRATYAESAADTDRDYDEITDAWGRRQLTDWPIRDLRRCDVVWANYSPTYGRDQSGERPASVVASNMYLDSVQQCT